MMRRLLRIVIVVGVLVAIAMAWTRRGRGGAVDVALPDVALPDVGVPDVAIPDVPLTKAAWVEPTGGGCPPGYEIKAKLSSGIYHLPGMVNYARTTPDRCYSTAEAAEADGLRPAKR